MYWIRLHRNGLVYAASMCVSRSITANVLSAWYFNQLALHLLSDDCQIISQTSEIEQLQQPTFSLITISESRWSFFLWNAFESHFGRWPVIAFTIRMSSHYLLKKCSPFCAIWHYDIAVLTANCIATRSKSFRKQFKGKSNPTKCLILHRQIHGDVCWYRKTKLINL